MLRLFHWQSVNHFNILLLNELSMTIYRVYRKHDFHKQFFIQQNKLKVKRRILINA